MVALTSQRYLDCYTSDEVQFKWLINKLIIFLEHATDRRYRLAGEHTTVKMPDYSLQKQTLVTLATLAAGRAGSLTSVWKLVQENPSKGEILPGMNNDPRFPVSAEFQKMQVVQKNAKGESITIHYQYNSTTGKAYDIKVDTSQIASSNPENVFENIKEQIK